MMKFVALVCGTMAFAPVAAASLPGQPPVQFPGGFLTQGPPRHISDTVFSFVPELRLNLGYQITPNINVFAGYSVLWWTNVIRAGEQTLCDRGWSDLKQAWIKPLDWA